jgi:hypothetical protein
VDFSVGCHSGLNVPDDQAVEHETDFCQVQARRGVSWMGNTGFGYGDADEIAYSEQLSLLFVRHLRRGESVGDALRLAKAEYFNRSGVHGFTVYDEKVLSEMTLYGLPMLHLEFPAPFRMTGPQWVQAEEELATRTPISDATGLTALRVAFDLPVVSKTITHGTYYAVNDEVEVVAGLPILPRTSVSVTLPGEQAQGAFFEGGHYEVYPDFDPVIATLVTDTAALAEPWYDFQEWVPSAWDLVNSLQTAEGLRQRLVVVPTQYRATTLERGEMRVFDALTYTVYYSDTEDVEPPSFWLVEDVQVGSSQAISVEVTDRSGIKRVAVAYTFGDGWWRTVDLAPTVEDEDVWVGVVPYAEGLTYLVQAVDGAGNVGAETNKAWYYGRDSTPPLTAALFDPALPEGENGWDRTVVTVTLSTRDGQSGVADTVYQVNGEGWQSYTTSLVVTVQGTTTVGYYSVDVAGNVEGVQTATVKLDGMAPTTTVELSPSSATGRYYSPLTLTLRAEDNASGVRHTLYQVNASGWQSYTMPLTITTVGTMTVGYHSVDVAGNEEAVQTVTVRVEKDEEMPTSVAEVSSLVDSPPITVTWVATDTMSGIASVGLWYRFGVEGAWRDSGLASRGRNRGRFDFSPVHGDGTYCFATQAADRAGNVESVPVGEGDGCCEYRGGPVGHHLYLPVVLSNGGQIDRYHIYLPVVLRGY